MKAAILSAFGVIGGAAAAYLIAMSLGAGAGPPRTADSRRHTERPAAARSRAEANGRTVRDAAASDVDSLAHDFRAALDAALERDDLTVQRGAVKEVVTVWARYDPRGALAEVARLPPRTAADLHAHVLREWAFVDPAGFFAHAESTNAANELAAGLAVLIATDPARVRSVLSRADAPRNAELDALLIDAVLAMVGSEPRAAVAELELLATGADRNVLLAQALEVYAAVDPDSAVGWVASMEPAAPPELRSALVNTIARRDLIRAFELADALDARGNELVTAALAGGQVGPAAVEELLRRGAELAPHANDVLRGWLISNPDAAMDWLVVNAARVDAGALRSLATLLETAFPERGIAGVDRMPAHARTEWVSGVAIALAQRDREGARAWVEQFRGRPEYADAYEQVR